MRTSDGRAVDELEQFLQTLLLEPFHHASYILGAFARTDEQGVGSFHNNEIGNPDCRDEFGGTRDEISAGIEGQDAAGGDVRARTFGQEFVNSGPGADVAPSDYRGNDKDTSMFGIA